MLGRFLQINRGLLQGLVVTGATGVVVALSYMIAHQTFLPLAGVVGLGLAVALLVYWRFGLFFCLGLVLVEGFARNYYQQPAILLIKDFGFLLIYARVFTERIIRRQPLIFYTPFNKYIIGLAALSVLELFNPNLTSLQVGLIGLRSGFVYLPMAFLLPELFQNRRTLERFNWIIVGIVPLVVGYGILQYYQGPEAYRALGPGFAQSIFVTGGELDTSLAIFRPASTFSYPSQYAVFVMAMLLYVLSLTFQANRQLRLVAWLEVPLLVFGLLTSGQRTFFVLAPVAIVVMLLITGRLNFGLKLAVPLIAGIVLVVNSEAGGAVVDRILTVSQNKDDVIWARLSAGWFNTLSGLGLAPLGVGTGMATLGSQYSDNGTIAYFFEGYYGKIAAELGWLGFAIYLMLMVSLARYVIGVYWREAMEVRYEIVAPLLFVFIVYYQNFITNAIDLSVTNIFFWFSVGLIYTLSQRKEKAENLVATKGFEPKLGVKAGLGVGQPGRAGQVSLAGLLPQLAEQPRPNLKAAQEIGRRARLTVPQEAATEVEAETVEPGSVKDDLESPPELDLPPSEAATEELLAGEAEVVETARPEEEQVGVSEREMSDEAATADDNLSEGVLKADEAAQAEAEDAVDEGAEQAGGVIELEEETEQFEAAEVVGLATDQAQAEGRETALIEPEQVEAAEALIEPEPLQPDQETTPVEANEAAFEATVTMAEVEPSEVAFEAAEMVETDPSEPAFEATVTEEESEPSEAVLETSIIEAEAEQFEPAFETAEVVEADSLGTTFEAAEAVEARLDTTEIEPTLLEVSEAAVEVEEVAPLEVTEPVAEEVEPAEATETQAETTEPIEETAHAAFETSEPMQNETVQRAEPGWRLALIQSFLPSESHGGVGYFTHYLANELVRRGHEVTIFSWHRAPVDALYKVQRLKLSRWLSWSKLARLYMFAWQVARQDFSQFDLIHAQGDDFLLWPSLRRRKPLVRTFQGSALGEAIYSRNWKNRLVQASLYPLEWLSGSLAGTTVGISQGTRHHLPFIERVIGQGVDLRVFRPDPAQPKSEQPTILFVGHKLDDRKRGRLLLEQFARVVRPALPTARLWLVCEEKVDWPGVECFSHLSEAELVALYRQAWIFCLPSAYEGFGRPYIEAMACGTPVVATPNLGANEVLDKGRYGWLVEPEELGLRLVRLLKDDTTRQTLAEQGLEWVRQWDWPQVASQYEELYRELLRERKLRPGWLKRRKKL